MQFPQQRAGGGFPGSSVPPCRDGAAVTGRERQRRAGAGGTFVGSSTAGASQRSRGGSRVGVSLDQVDRCGKDE